MQQDLAQKLLTATLDWDVEQIIKYRELIEDLSDYKYNQYQQYKPSCRFIEHLSIWLNQFDEDERKLALEFLLNNLIFISPAEMIHLVDTAYYEVVEPILQKQLTDGYSNVSDNTNLLKIIKRKNLFLALSDGARIDILRRNSQLNHDQVCVNYDLSETKFGEILKSMGEDTGAIICKIDEFSNISFPTLYNIFLFDDFSGSGISYLRYESNMWKGKIIKVLNCLEKEEIISENQCQNPTIHIILYLATNQAENAIKENLEQYRKSKRTKIDIEVHVVQYIEKVCLTTIQEKWLKRYYDNTIEDSHFRKGDMSKPYLGFDGCSLALVLYHNTPNNSFPILWAGENALFPRVTRHKDVN